MGVGDTAAYIKQTEKPGQHSQTDRLDFWACMSRAGDTLTEGTWRGLGSALLSKADNPGTTLLEVGAAAGVGLLLSRAQPGAGFTRLAIETVGLGLSYSFAKHTTGQLIPFSQALRSSWNSSADLERNKDVVGATLAPFLVDSAFTIGPAMAVARFDMRNADLRLLSQRLTAEAGDSVVKVRTIRGTGSAFVLDSSGTLGTAYHVAKSAYANKLLLETSEGSIGARAVAALPYEDVALIQANKALAKKPLALAEDTTGFPLRNSKEPHVNGAALGFPNGRDFSARGGRFSNFMPGDKVYQHDGEKCTLLDRMLFGARTQKGMSGGPVVDANNKVIGVNIQGLDDIVIGADALASPVENLRKLITLTERAKTGGGLTVEQASKKLGISPEEVTSRLNKGKLDGFLLAEQPYDTTVIAGKTTQWSWVVLLPPGT